MVHRGQIYRKVGDIRVWEVIAGPDHENEWFLRSVDGDVDMSVHERGLKNRDLWVPVRDT